METKLVATTSNVNEWQALKEQATLAQRSGLLPKAVDTPEKAIVIAMMGRELGLSTMAALTGIYVVNGLATVRGSLMLRLIYERCPGARITVLTPPEQSNLECEVEMQRPNAKPQRFKFTLDDAKRAGFMGKSVWQQHTSTMLRWAAIRTGARIVFADTISGCYLEDEINTANVTQEDPLPLEALQPPAKPVAEPDYSGVAKYLDAKIVEEKEWNDAGEMIDSIGRPMDGPSSSTQPIILPTQRKQIFEAAQLAGVGNEELLAYIQREFGVKTTHALTLLQFNKLIAHLNVIIEKESTQGN